MESPLYEGPRAKPTGGTANDYNAQVLSLGPGARSGTESES